MSERDDIKELRTKLNALADMGQKRVTLSSKQIRLVDKLSKFGNYAAINDGLSIVKQQNGQWWVNGLEVVG